MVTAADDLGCSVMTVNWKSMERGGQEKDTRAAFHPAWYGSDSAEWDQALVGGKPLSTTVLALLSGVYTV